MAVERRPVRSGDLLGGGLVVLTSVQFGGVVVLGKILERSDLPVPSLLAIRFAFAAILLALTLAALRQSLAAAPGEGWRLAVLGMAGYAVEAGLFFAALRHGTVAAVTLLFFTYPVFVSAFALLGGRGLPGPVVGLSLGIAVAGVALVVVTGEGVSIDAAGVGFAIGSALTFALYLTGADVVLKRTNSLVGSMWVSGASALALAAYALVTGAARWPSGWSQWGAVFGMGAFTAGAFVCLLGGLRRLGPVRTSIVAATEPLASSGLAVLFLGERLRAGTILGGLMILVSAIAASLARREAPAEPAEVGP